MCAIAAIFEWSQEPLGETSAERLGSELAAITEAQAARGPDGSGRWLDPRGGLGLGHRRLSIRDLDPRAGQPMHSANGRYVLSFNGELYNEAALRQQLEAGGFAARTSSDSEVLLEGFARFGPALFQRLRGMYALCLWDRQERRLWLARDPYGIKPLYYAAVGGSLKVASQVKALLAGGGVSSERDPAALAGFLLEGSVPEPLTIHRDVRALPPGAVFCCDHRGLREAGPRQSLVAVLEAAEGLALEAGPGARPSPEEFEAQVRAATGASVRAHALSADVPVGLFLSAGIDSSAIAALMREQCGGTILAVTLAFEEYVGRVDDELPLAGRVAREFELEHRVVRLTRADFEGALPGYLEAMDQPSIDGLNTYLVSRAARQAGLSVALSGLGGDELLGGYPSFRQVPKLARLTRCGALVPGLARLWRGVLGQLLPKEISPKWSALLEVRGDLIAAYALRRGLFLPHELPLLLGPELARAGLEQLTQMRRDEDQKIRALRTPWARVCALESTRYMKNQLLRDSDWASMAHGLELRVPLVDFELLKQLAPALAALAEAPGKTALFKAPTKPLPGEILSRPKTGFTLPLASWFEGHSTLDLSAPVGSPWPRRLALALAGSKGSLAA